MKKINLLKEEINTIAVALNDTQNKLESLIRRAKEGNFSYNERSSMGVARGDLDKARKRLFRIYYNY